MRLSRNIIIFIVIAVAAMALFAYFTPATKKPEEISLGEAIAMSRNGEIEETVIDGEQLLMTSTAGTELKTVIGSLSAVDLQELGYIFEEGGPKVKPSGFNWGLLINFLPLILFGGLLFFLFRRAQGANSQAMSFGRSRARLFPAHTPTVTFDDVAGVEEAKQELHEVVEFLKSREKFQKLGARIPKGLLLVGPPGTGKTLLARAIAGEAGVPFFSISGSEFVEMFVGVGASRVRDLFDQAKRNTPCIVFIDEIDAVGRHRGAGLGGGHDEREQTLNQILTEMDGFDTNTNVIILAATNRPDILDPALLRPGRFDRRVILDRPDINGRKAILKVHSNGKPLAESVSLEVLARQTAGFSGADLANLVNEAAIMAARRGKQVIEMQEFEESIDRVIAGPERKSRRISPKEKEITAYHEAGHALVAKMLPNADPVHKISIVARGMSLGHTRQLPTEDRYLMTRSQFNDMVATLLAGHTAEKLIFNETTTGAYDDIERATTLARKMVTEYGMSDKLGPRTFGHKEELIFLGREITEQRNYSEKVAQEIDGEVHNIIQHAYKAAKKILTENKPKLIYVAQKLIAHESLEGEELDLLLNQPVPSPLPEAAATPAPTPAKTTTKTKKAPIIPQPLPKQAPAAPDMA
ncbi:MAG: ATP-dependent zinc metalloprotease FtsH [Dehalococcoidia bacterium]|nr:MAG: ATP-dependent zinc metalloprotease FtsH [Dehalococcoidia bacterium]